MNYYLAYSTVDESQESLHSSCTTDRSKLFLGADTGANRHHAADGELGALSVVELLQVGQTSLTRVVGQYATIDEVVTL